MYELPAEIADLPFSEALLRQETTGITGNSLVNQYLEYQQARAQARAQRQAREQAQTRAQRQDEQLQGYNNLYMEMINNEPTGETEQED